jgi:DNA-binding NarL/FixJ family response regulator
VIRVVIADDQQLVRDGFHAILDDEPDIEVVGVASDGREAIRMVRDLLPDVVVMDIRMPLMDGIEATRQIAAGPGTTRVLVLTTFDLDEHVYDAMRSGASGFLLKDVPRGRLADGVRTVAVGETLLDPTVARRLVERFVRLPAPGTGIPERLRPLSSRELEILRSLARGLSNAEIAAELYLSPATVKTHVASILRKLGLRDRIQAVVLAYETGLLQPGAPPQGVDP